MADAKKPTTTAITRSLGASLAIQSVDELMRLAQILYAGGASNIAGLGRPEAVAHVILAGAEVGLSPTQALGSIMLLDGKASIYGDGALAVVRASGLLDGEVNETVEGDGDARTGTCKLKRKGESEKTFTFSMGEAKRAGLIDRAKGKGPWATYPDRMLKMRARGFALRDLFSDVLRGLTMYEEAADASVVETEVKVVSVAGVPLEATPAATVTTAPVATSPTTTTASASTVEPAKQLDGPITDAQKEELLHLRKLVMASKAITDPLQIKAEWDQIIAPYNVASALALTASQAADLITSLGKAHDPFGHPDSNRGAAA